ncbi:MAG: hormogonium polysaccharide biosynthesis glycosyltransferase HpsE [Spirulinaceae cyanobacterium]
MFSNSIDITVAICTYNGEKRLPRVLEALRSQTQVNNITWEVIVINNNSRDRTEQVVHRYQQDFPCPLYLYFEPQPGIAIARRLAVKMAKGELIAFVDDDNIPAQNWVNAAVFFARNHPQAGAFGSRLFPEYEVPPPVNFEQIACFLAISDRGDVPFRYDLLNRWLFPAGAGMVIRTQAWLECVPVSPLLTGVSQQSLSAKGEDIETLSYLRQKGWQIWHNPDLKITHVVPKRRLEKPYLFRLFRGVGLSRYPTRKLQFSTIFFPLILILYWLNDGHKLLFFFGRNLLTTKVDLVAQCKRELWLYSLLSPFYHWWHFLNRKLTSQFVGLRQKII